MVGLMNKLLCLAAEEGSSTAVEQLVEGYFFDGWVVDVDHPDDNWRTALSHAASRGDADLLKLLIHHKACVNVTDRAGVSPIGAACEAGRLECASLLLEARADVNGKDANSGITHLTPLMLACSRGRAGCAMLLTKHLADPNIRIIKSKTAKHGPRDALEYAEACEDKESGEECVQLLKDSEQMHQKLRDDSKGWLSSSEVHAKQHSKSDGALTEVLTGVFVRTHARSKRVIEKLFSAIRAGNESNVNKWLRDGGKAEVNDVFLWDCSPLSAAALVGCADIVKLLLKNKANPAPSEELISKGGDPLMFAATSDARSAPRCVRMLLDAGAQPYRLTHFDITVAAHAKVAGRWKCCKEFDEFDELQQKHRQGVLDIVKALCLEAKKRLESLLQNDHAPLPLKEIKLAMQQATQVLESAEDNDVVRAAADRPSDETWRCVMELRGTLAAAEHQCTPDDAAAGEDAEGAEDAEDAEGAEGVEGVGTAAELQRACIEARDEASGLDPSSRLARLKAAIQSSASGIPADLLKEARTLRDQLAEEVRQAKKKEKAAAKEAAREASRKQQGGDSSRNGGAGTGDGGGAASGKGSSAGTCGGGTSGEGGAGCDEAGSQRPFTRATEAQITGDDG